MSKIQIKEHDHIKIISINRPEARNALSSEIIFELDKIFSELTKDKNCRALVIHGEGKAFSAGADLKERQTMGDQEVMDFVAFIQATFQKLSELPMPTIAAINGDAFGGGLELALACDLRVINSMAHVGLTETSLGIIPGAGGTQRLPRIIGIAKAMELIFLARRISAAEALSLGLANFLATDSESTIKLALKIGLDIAQNGPLAIRASKQAIKQFSTDLENGLANELACYRNILKTSDRLEGLKAFLEKRPPEFTGN
jgi:methylglutaconyl-CoA hydratase